ncbi:MAG: MarP family serine protease [Thermoleophilaceae bacterium]|nr:MarP family serine protease [Thermoleophilaceae bacterium]
MLILDLLIVAIVMAGAVWGYREGLSTAAFALAGFAVGAIIGSRVAPLALDDGYRDTFAPVASLPAAILLGALLAAAFERIGAQVRRRLRRPSLVDAIGGTLLAACVAVVAVWALGTIAAQVDDLKGELKESAILERLNAAVPPPGPLLNPTKRRADALPARPKKKVGPANPADIKRDPQVLAAAPSVVKIKTEGGRQCGPTQTGSGWIARDGIVVTNAHLVDGADKVTALFRGEGYPRRGEVIVFDKVNDIAVVRVPGLKTKPALRLGLDPQSSTQGATLGYPRGGTYKVLKTTADRPANITIPTRGGGGIPWKFVPFRAPGLEPGSSGGPLVDRRGRVIAMTSYKPKEHENKAGVGFGVSVESIRPALRRAGPPVAHRSCMRDGRSGIVPP